MVVVEPLWVSLFSGALDKGKLFYVWEYVCYLGQILLYVNISKYHCNSV